ncbi:hypothetical protein GCM10022223_38900 [Kineosporia mesophila]|uniref:HTH cro/C1-type domain-containing protein n=1 Tax=Kineosporia mesophila TaxID=566012 RepID=A0ABP6ZS33_9ACTN|nr:helix-turn-helix transcriptional regulator [Kineosporia mesophila]
MADLQTVIAANVRSERARLKLTQRQLGERLGVSGDTVSDIESGQRTTTANDIPRFCEALGITITELFARAEPDDLGVMGLQ